MEPLRELTVVRTVLAPVTCRDARTDTGSADGSMPVMEVRFSPFGRWYEIDSWWEGQFLERTAPGAFKKTISERTRPLPVMFNHGRDYTIGNKLLGEPLRLTEEADSPVVDVQLHDTSYVRDLLPGLRAGLYGSSFMFEALAHVWEEEPGQSEWNPRGLPERTLTEVRLLEAGPVTWPANPAATSGVRAATVVSHTDEHYDRLADVDPDRVEQLRAAVRSRRATPGSRTPDAGPPAPGQGGTTSGAASSSREPAHDHSSESPNPRARWLTAFRAKHLPEEH